MAPVSARHLNAAFVPDDLKSRLRVMFLAKHARDDGRPDTVDGNHAVYHHELRTSLERSGFNIIPATSFAEIEQKPDVDFVITLLNRAGFEHSEMLAPLQLFRFGLPFLGASPILRGLADDKHLMKAVARLHDVPTADWAAFRRGTGEPKQPDIGPFPWVVKPNASSASWGVAIVHNWEDTLRNIHDIWSQRQDVIVERWQPKVDVAVPVIGGADGQPWILPPMMYLPEDGRLLRSYEEKRGLVPTSEDDPLVIVDDPAMLDRLEAITRPLIDELWPFDYGRFEFRFDPESGDLNFMEVNLSCNLWSKKTISRSARSLGVDHDQLVEAIVAHSMMRQGLLTEQAVAAA